MWPLLGLSVITLHLIIQYLFQVRAGIFYDRQISAQIAEHLQHGRFMACQELLRNNKSVLGRMMLIALNERERGYAAMENAMLEIMEEYRSEFFRKLEWLNIIGNVAPMIGLFGTVWGMIMAFSAIVDAGGRPQPVDLASGISNALVTTLWGMAVAIPALSGSGYLSNRFEALTARTAVIAEELLSKMPLPLRRGGET